MSELKFLQLSTSTCNPCKMMRNYVEKTYDSKDINYEFVDIQRSDKYALLVRALQVRSVPTSVIIKGDNILAVNKGFNIPFVDNYVKMFYAERNGDYLEEEE